MKWIGLLLIATPLVACSPGDSAKTNTFVYVLPDGHIKIGEVTTDPQSMLKLLGPPDTTEVVFVACPTTSYQSVRGLLAKIEGADYTHYGFADTLKPEDPLCTKR